MREDVRLWLRPEGGHADETSIIAEASGKFGFGRRGLSVATNSCDERKVAWGRALFGRDRGGREGEYGAEKIMLGVANFKLRRVHAHRPPAGARRKIITREGALMLLGKTALRIEGERVGWDDVAGEEMGAKIHAGGRSELAAAGFKMRGFTQ